MMVMCVWIKFNEQLCDYIFCSLVPNVENSLNQPHPNGLLLLEEFITEDEERQLVDCVAETSELDSNETSAVFLFV